jgi:hypothetical protein
MAGLHALAVGARIKAAQLQARVDNEAAIMPEVSIFKSKSEMARKNVEYFLLEKAKKWWRGVPKTAGEQGMAHFGAVCRNKSRRYGRL